MNSWEHIVWDWNGTLLADTSICVEVLNELMEDRGLSPITLGRYRETFDFPVIEFYRSLGFPTAREAFEATSHDFIARYAARAEACPLHNGAAELLHRLADEERGQSVLSAAQQAALEQAVRAYGLARCFHHLVGATDIFAHGKEEAGIRWLRATGHDPRSVLLVGDTLHDHKVARAMGVRCVLVAHGHHSRARLESTGAPVVEGFAELGEWMGA
ncbi:MAG: HAD family hydrolase [Puniceicoccaceae bacterium]